MLCRFIVIALSLSLTVNILACPQPWNSTFNKRWYSVGRPSIPEPNTINAWPEKAPGIQPVRYCWVKQSDRETLEPILKKAIQKWHWEIENSALQILPDQPKGPNICGQKGVQDDALHIEDITKSESTSAGLTTQGYYGHLETLDPGRHTMKFHIEFPQPKGKEADPHDVLMMAHELGHAIGLDHEHSRPDAAEHLWFYCENLEDYEKVKAKIKAPDTIGEACKSRTMALKYSFSAWAYLPDPRHGQLGQNAWSKEFDRDSIMIYSSYNGGKEHPPEDNSFGKPVLLGHPKGEKNPKAGKRYKLYMGGSPNKAQAGVSMGDAARVAQLYPPKDKRKAEIAGAGDEEWQGITSALLPVKREVKTTSPR